MAVPATELQRDLASGRGSVGVQWSPLTVTPVVVHSPAKLNLFLAITGRRPDGFHDLVSLVVPVAFGDTLTVEPTADGVFTLTCDVPGLAVDESNLILKAARLFAQESGWAGGARFSLEKRIPMGAGLGGGSSNATATLRALNTLAGQPLDEARLTTLAAKLGSDCVLFLHERPVIMRGRGERVEPLPEMDATRLRGRSLLVFKPDLSISTPWAYGQMVAAAPRLYLPEADAEARLAGWRSDPGASIEDVLFNNMETAAFAKYLPLPTLLEQLRTQFGLKPRMSGSGSACFAFLPDGAPVAEIETWIRNAWGVSVFLVQTRIA